MADLGSPTKDEAERKDNNVVSESKKLVDVKISGDRQEGQTRTSPNSLLANITPEKPTWSKNEPFEHYRKELQTYSLSLNSLSNDPKFKLTLEKDPIVRKEHEANLEFVKSELERVSKIQRPPKDRIQKPLNSLYDIIKGNRFLLPK